MDHVPCPFCGTLDYAQTIRAVFNEGLSVTKGSAVSFDPSTGKLVNTFYSSETRSDLCTRLTPVVRPGGMSAHAFSSFFLLLLLPVTFILTLLVFKTNPSSDLLQWVIPFALMVPPAIGVSMVLTPICMIINYILRSNSRIQWDTSERIYASSLYCHQDDVVFDNEYWGIPEEYAYYMFHR